MDNFEFDEYDIKAKVNWKIWKRVIKNVLSFRKLFLIATISVIIVALIETLYFYFISLIGIEEIVRGGNFNYLAWFVPIMIVFSLGQAIFVYTFIYYTARLEINFYKKHSKATFHHLQELPFSFYDKNSTGWLLARVTSDNERLGEIVSWGTVDLMWAIFKLIFVLTAMLLIHWQFALIMLIIIPVIIFVSIRFNRLIIHFARKVRRINSKITGSLNEGITGAKTTKSLNLEDKNLNEFQKLSRKFRKTTVTSSVISSLYYQIISIVAGLGIVFIIYQGGLLVIDEVFTLSTLFFLVMATMSFFDPILNIAFFANDMKHAQVAAERVFNLIDIKPAIADRDDVIAKYGTTFEHKKENWEDIKGDVEFKNVSFSYGPDNPVILNDFSLKVNACQTIAIVGETGAGKSTIINLLCRFYEPTSGIITIDGKDYQDRSVAWLHANLGYVLQSPHLFSGSIRENIRYGKLSASDQEIEDAAKIVGAHQFITSLENGYDTEVGETGAKLSLGQKQLLSFARAIIANPRILVLDEATSSIDTETEFELQNAIKELLANRTSFVIAHRLSTIKNADMIIVLQKGVILEAGTHDELLSNKNYYYNLYTNQFIEEKMREMNF